MMIQKIIQKRYIKDKNDIPYDFDITSYLYFFNGILCPELLKLCGKAQNSTKFI